MGLLLFQADLNDAMEAECQKEQGRLLLNKALMVTDRRMYTDQRTQSSISSITTTTTSISITITSISGNKLQQHQKYAGTEGANETLQVQHDTLLPILMKDHSDGDSVSASVRTVPL